MFVKGVKFLRQDLILMLFGITYLAFVLLHIISEPSSFMIFIKGIGLYLLFPCYWLILFRCKSEFLFFPFLKTTVKWALFISLMGIVQFYFSPDIWGLLSKSASANIQWSSDIDRIEYLLFFRSTSFFSSPQVFGLFSALYIFIIYKVFSNNSKACLFFILICFIGSVHSGNKMTYLIVIVFLMMLLKKFILSLNFLKIFAMLIFLTTLFFSLINLSEKHEIGIITRIISSDQVLDEEKEGRVRIYLNMFESANLLFGTGPGSISTSESAGGKVAESYLLQILIEHGILFLVFFLIFYYVIVFKGFRNINPFFYLSVAIFISMIFVHVFSDPVFFVFWGVIIFGYVNVFKRNIPNTKENEIIST
ncbi:MAG: hypothetical protein GW823_08250 [Bacteroidetes bacterium]|nr:hypothetical protein [Bacteroidota bacterium]